MSTPPHPPSSSPDTLCCEFSRSLDQCFAWSPPDLSVSSQSCSSMVPLSSSEMARLGLSHFESESAPSSLFLAQQIASRGIEWEHMGRQGMTGEYPSTRNDVRTSCIASSGRIDELGNRNFATEPSEPRIKRYSIHRAMSLNRFGRPRQNLASAHSNLLPRTPSSSALFSSTSRDFSSQSFDNIRKIVFGEHRRTGDENGQHDGSSSDNYTLFDTIRHRPRSYPALANDDVPSALDFHINTFPPFRPFDSSAGFLHPLLLPSSSTSETFSPLPTLSDRTDIHRQLIYFPSPTISLSRFPSSLSSPAICSTEISEGATTVFPPNWGAEDIIVDMTPISDEGSISAYEVPDATRVREWKHKERLTERIAKLGGKFKRALLNRIQILKTQSKGNSDHDFRHRECCPAEPSAMETPPSLTISNDLTEPLEPSDRQSVNVQETSGAQMFPLLEISPQVEPHPLKSMRKKFSLSIFARPSSVMIPSEPRKQKQARPKSMPDLSNQYPTGSTLVESFDGNNKRSKRSKKLSLLFLRNRS